MAVAKPTIASAASYRVFNADGSEVEQCGNGVRCVARMLVAGTRHATARFSLQSPAGLVAARVTDNGREPSAWVHRFSTRPASRSLSKRAETYTLHVEMKALDDLRSSMGNPHCVLQVADVETATVSELGPLIEHHARFPERTNVGFMHIVDRRASICACMSVA